MATRRRSVATLHHCLVINVVLRDVEPPIWRRIQVPESYSLDRLHRILQLVFGWLDYHLYEFEIGGRRFEAPHEEAEHADASGTDLRSLKLQAGDAFRYVYDFGDDWIHDCTIEDRVPVTGEWDLLPRLLDGAMAGPLEDSGGPFSVSEVRSALRDPGHPRHRELRDWAGSQYDPERFDPWLANQNLTLAAAWGAV